jgi:hypothetical protein
MSRRSDKSAPTAALALRRRRRPARQPQPYRPSPATAQHYERSEWELCAAFCNSLAISEAELTLIHLESCAGPTTKSTPPSSNIGRELIRESRRRSSRASGKFVLLSTQVGPQFLGTARAGTSQTTGNNPSKSLSFPNCSHAGLTATPTRHE